MIEEEKAARTYHHEMPRRSYDRSQVVAPDRRLDGPTRLEVLKAARGAARGDQTGLEYGAA